MGPFAAQCLRVFHLMRSWQIDPVRLVTPRPNPQHRSLQLPGCDIREPPWFQESCHSFRGLRFTRQIPGHFNPFVPLPRSGNAHQRKLLLLQSGGAEMLILRLLHGSRELLPVFSPDFP